MIDQKLLGKKIWVLDGAMDTMLLAGGVEDPDPERVNLTHPAVVADVYREYIEAGADIIRSNTFGADPLTQKDFGLASGCPPNSEARTGRMPSSKPSRPRSGCSRKAERTSSISRLSATCAMRNWRFKPGMKRLPAPPPC